LAQSITNQRFIKEPFRAKKSLISKEYVKWDNSVSQMGLGQRFKNRSKPFETKWLASFWPTQLGKCFLSIDAYL